MGQSQTERPVTFHRGWGIYQTVSGRRLLFYPAPRINPGGGQFRGGVREARESAEAVRRWIDGELGPVDGKRAAAGDRDEE